jgi:NhaP-type Na+/H+ or K+/H+ antiporter
MAEVRLGRNEVEKDRLPDVCMVCGGRATVKRKKWFKWYPPHAGLLGGALLALIMTKRMKVSAPLCHVHRNHWLLRSLLSFFGFIGVFVISGALLFVVAAKSGEHGASEKPLLIALGVGGVLIVGWLIMTIVMQHTAIRAKEITDKSMTLTGVSVKFRTALHELRDERRNEQDRPRKPVRSRAQSDDEDEAEDE